MKSKELIEKYKIEDSEENPNRPKRKSYATNKEYKRARSKYCMNKMLNDDGFWGYLFSQVARGGIFRESYSNLIRDYYQLKVKNDI